MSKSRWLADPEAHDYDAALDYLTLLTNPTHAHGLIAALSRAKTESRYKAKDIIRASGLPLLSRLNDHHVDKDYTKLVEEVPLSPVLLVAHTPLLIADGYHRVCAVYAWDYDAVVPARIVDW